MGKKRVRDAGGEVGTSSAAASASASSRVKLVKGVGAAILVSFPSGYLPEARKIPSNNALGAPREKSPTAAASRAAWPVFPTRYRLFPQKTLQDSETFGVWQRSARGSAQKELLAASSGRDGVRFEGRTAVGRPGFARPSYAVGVWDPKRRELTLAAASSSGQAPPLRLEPRVDGLDYDARWDGDSDVAGRNAAEGSEESPTARRAREKGATRDLVAAFGSGRRLRQLAARERGAVGDDNVGEAEGVAGLLTEARGKLAEAGLDKASVMAAVAESKQSVPPHVPTATTAEDAFPFDRACPAAARRALVTSDLLAFARKSNEELGLGGTVKEEEGATAAPTRLELRPAVVRRLLLAPGGLRSDVQAGRIAVAESKGRWLSWFSALFSYLSTCRDTERIPTTEEGGLGALADRLNTPLAVLDSLLPLFSTRVEPGPDEGRPGDEFGDTGGKGARRPRLVRDRRGRDLLLASTLLAALGACGWRLGGNQVDDVRFSLKTDAKAIAVSLRSLGCDVVAEKETARDGSRLYSASLLQRARLGAGADGKRTLAEAFPKPKRMMKR